LRRLVADAEDHEHGSSRREVDSAQSGRLEAGLVYGRQVLDTGEARIGLAKVGDEETARQKQLRRGDVAELLLAGLRSLAPVLTRLSESGQECVPGFMQDGEPLTLDAVRRPNSNDE